MTKAEIRKLITERKRNVPCLETLSAQIVEKIQSLEAFQSAKTVGVYMPMPDEVDVTPLLQQPKRFYVPAFDDASGEYRMARLTTELIKGRFGILEPENPVFAREDGLDLILVPGVAFDRAGRRIGRGGGFYDRLLPQHHAVRVGICFDFQCLEVIPAEEHDVPMGFVVTEKQIFKVCDEH